LASQSTSPFAIDSRTQTVSICSRTHVRSRRSSSEQGSNAEASLWCGDDEVLGRQSGDRFPHDAEADAVLVGEVPELDARPGQPPAEQDVGAAAAQRAVWYAPCTAIQPTFGVPSSSCVGDRLVDVLGEGPALSLSCYT
jgi:hypothetical protein